MDTISLIFSASATTVVVFSLINLGIKNRNLGIQLTWKFIILVLVSLFALILQNFNSSIDVFLFVLLEFILIIILYYSYLKAALYQIFFLPIDLLKETVIVISLYFSLFMTLSFLEKKHMENKGNLIIFISLVVLDISLILYVLFLIFGYSDFSTFSYVTFDLFIIWFFSPFILPSELTYEKE